MPGGYSIQLHVVLRVLFGYFLVCLMQFVRSIFVNLKSLLILGKICLGFLILFDVAVSQQSSSSTQPNSS